MSGIVALIGLGRGAVARPRVPGAVAAAALSAAAFGAAMIAAAGHWGSLIIGAMDIDDWTIYPAPAVFHFAVIASAGTVLTLVLLGVWLRPGDDEW